MTDELIKRAIIRAEYALTCMIPPFAKGVIQDLLAEIQQGGEDAKNNSNTDNT